MSLLWKLLRQHISIGQFAGFFVANLLGMIIVLSGYQFYNDVLPIFTNGDSFMKSNAIMVTKRIGTGNALSSDASTFSAKDIAELEKQPFTRRTGAFMSANYKTHANMGISGTQIFSSEIFFESIPDEFIDINMKDWRYNAGDDIVPIILPRSYINIYNFGFARSHALPQISDGLMGMIDLQLRIRANGKEQTFQGKVVAFSSSMTSILVPEAFMKWSNETFAPEGENVTTRLLMEVANPGDKALMAYFEKNGLEMDSDKLNAEKTTYFLRLIVSMVMVIGIIISALSFYILMLSIYLLVQKNTEKLQNLLLIGYRSTRVALPYQLLTGGLNLLVLLIAIVAVWLIRNYYVDIIAALYPEIGRGSILYSILLGIVLFLIVTLLNVIIIRRKVGAINSHTTK
ncbi:MAG: ABC transporter permease [Prevotella sp.]|nr:ABC transporter permease [Prevotella sp.]